MAQVPSIPHSGVSRRALARSRAVRLMTGIAFLLGAATIVPVFLALDLPVRDGAPAIALGVFSGMLVLALPSPRVGSTWNHALLMAAWGVPVLAYYAGLPGSAQITASFTFTGALVAFRLTDRCEIAAHLATVIVLLALPIAFGVADTPTIASVLILCPALISLAAIVTVVLEAAEIQGQELEGLVRRDPLTGVGNRRLLGERLEYELARHGRSEQPLSLLALDLNGFKHVNDTLGHAAGDELLVAVATTLMANVRAQDTVVRQGGDEFCILLPETATADAERIGGSLRQALSAVVAGGAPLTTGLGIVEFPQDGADADGILRLADARLRADKAGDGPSRGPAVRDVSE